MRKMLTNVMSLKTNNKTGKNATAYHFKNKINSFSEQLALLFFSSPYGTKWAYMLIPNILQNGFNKQNGPNTKSVYNFWHRDNFKCSAKIKVVFQMLNTCVYRCFRGSGLTNEPN